VSHSILVVDDAESILFAIRVFFQAKGFAVDCARELEEAEALLANRTYDAVIVDLRLTGFQGTEGLEIISYVREISSKTRVILITSFGSPEIEQEARRRGVDAFLHKPVALPDLAMLVSSLLVGSQDDAGTLQVAGN